MHLNGCVRGPSRSNGEQIAPLLHRESTCSVFASGSFQFSQWQFSATPTIAWGTSAATFCLERSRAFRGLFQVVAGLFSVRKAMRETSTIHLSRCGGSISFAALSICFDNAGTDLFIINNILSNAFGVDVTWIYMEKIVSYLRANKQFYCTK